MTLGADELAWISSVTGRHPIRARSLRSLWGGYGSLERIELEGDTTVIAKVIRPPRPAEASVSHLRKCRSYEIELGFYRDFAARCDEGCRVPACLGSRTSPDGAVLLLEDLDAAGFPRRGRRPSPLGTRACLRWLARFHARFVGGVPEGLWTRGTYWHLATRQEELAAVDDDELRRAAVTIDRALGTARHQTFVHGDAKAENFCWSNDERDVAAVDFQYVGGGIGVQDVAYFLASLSSDGRDVTDPALLGDYFTELDAALEAVRPDVDRRSVLGEWRRLYEMAAADFYRFYAGWAPHAFQREGEGRRLLARVTRDVHSAASGSGSETS